MLKSLIHNANKDISHKNRTYALISMYKQGNIQIKNSLTTSVYLDLDLDQDRDQGRTECQPMTHVNMRNRVNLSGS